MWDTSDLASHQNYEPIIAAMASDTLKFGKPVLYLNGDSHVFRSDDPLEQGSTCFTESALVRPRMMRGTSTRTTTCRSFHRIVVHGSTFPLEWLKLTIDQGPAPIDDATATSWGPFTWVRETQSQLTPS